MAPWVTGTSLLGGGASSDTSNTRQKGVLLWKRGNRPEILVSFTGASGLPYASSHSHTPQDCGYSGEGVGLDMITLVRGLPLGSWRR